MASAKTQKYSRKDLKISRFAKALGHPARIAILRYLASLETCCFNEISRELPIADSTVSQHISELMDAGLIQGEYDPPRVRYCINKKNWELAKKYLTELMDMRIVKAD